MRSFLKSQSIDCIAWTSISRVMHNYREEHNNYRRSSLYEVRHLTREQFGRHLKHECEFIKISVRLKMPLRFLHAAVHGLHIQNA